MVTQYTPRSSGDPRYGSNAPDPHVLRTSETLTNGPLDDSIDDPHHRETPQDHTFECLQARYG